MKADQDYDELESDHEEGENADGSIIRDRLPMPVAFAKTTLELHRLIHDGLIDLNPPYQRDVVWGQDKQMALIESLFRNFYVPPVLFFVDDRKKEEDKGVEGPVQVCMDGKQRLSSILSFLDGQIPYKDPVTKTKYFYTMPPGQKGKCLVLPDIYKKEFEEKHITCVEYRDIDPTMERDIFQRVQLGMSLTAAEKMQAVSSPYADWINRLHQAHISSERDEPGEGMATLFPWKTERGTAFQNVAQFIYCFEKLPAKVFPSATSVGEWLKRLDPPGRQLQKDVDEVLSLFWVIASTTGLREPLTDTTLAKKVSPAEFVYIALLISELRHCDHKTISDEILSMRIYVRSKFKDVRMNSSVTSRLWEYIQIAKENVRPRVVRFSDERNVPSSAGSKRRRDGDGSDDEYRPPPITSMGVAPKTRSQATD